MDKNEMNKALRKIESWFHVDSERRMEIRLLLLRKEASKEDRLFDEIKEKIDENDKLATDYFTTYNMLEKEYPKRVYGLPKIIRGIFHYHRESKRYLDLLIGVHENWKKELDNL